MKITKQGVRPETRVWVGKCYNCKSEIEAVETEMTNIKHDQRESTRFSWEKCPACHAGDMFGYGGTVCLSPRDER